MEMQNLFGTLEKMGECYGKKGTQVPERGKQIYEGFIGLMGNIHAIGERDVRLMIPGGAKEHKLSDMISPYSSFGLAVDKLLSGSYNDNNARTMSRQEYSSAALEGGGGNGILSEPGRRY